MIEKILSRFREVGNIQFSSFSKPLIAVEDAIKIVQEVAKEYGWIPVTEKLPEEEGWYRVTCDNSNYWKTPIVRDLYYYPRIKCFVDNIRRSEHPYEDIKKFDWTEDVTAWKPVEAPYQKGE